MPPNTMEHDAAQARKNDKVARMYVSPPFPFPIVTNSTSTRRECRRQTRSHRRPAPKNIPRQQENSGNRAPDVLVPFQEVQFAEGRRVRLLSDTSDPMSPTQRKVTAPTGCLIPHYNDFQRRRRSDTPNPESFKPTAGNRKTEKHNGAQKRLRASMSSGPHSEYEAEGSSSNESDDFKPERKRSCVRRGRTNIRSPSITRSRSRKGLRFASHDDAMTPMSSIDESQPSKSTRPPFRNVNRFTPLRIPRSPPRDRADADFSPTSRWSIDSAIGRDVLHIVPRPMTPSGMVAHHDCSKCDNLERQMHIRERAKSLKSVEKEVFERRNSLPTRMTGVETEVEKMGRERVDSGVDVGGREFDIDVVQDCSV